MAPRQTAAVADSYRYAVRSVDARGNAAAPVEITLNMADRPESIAAFKTTARSDGEGVMVAWSSVDPWTVDERPLPTYKILRTDTATGETAVVDRCKPFTSVDQPLTDPDTYWTWADDDAPLAARKQVNGRCWDVQGESETTYEYRVVTTDRYGKASQPGPPATATTPDTERPGPVGNLTAERVPLGVRLTWTPPTDTDVRSYHVWQGVTDPDSGETVWKENCWSGDSMAETERLCPTVADGAVHTYKVAATDDRLPHDAIPLDVLHTTEVSVALPETRPPGWTQTDVRQGQYPNLYVGCSASSGLGDCSRFASYRVERWDPPHRLLRHPDGRHGGRRHVLHGHDGARGPVRPVLLPRRTPRRLGRRGRDAVDGARHLELLALTGGGTRGRGPETASAPHPAPATTNGRTDAERSRAMTNPSRLNGGSRTSTSRLSLSCHTLPGSGRAPLVTELHGHDRMPRGAINHR